MKRLLKALRRPFRYAYLKAMRIKDSPHRIAAGFAAGASVSMLPLPGVHFLLGFGVAFLTRGGMLASAIGTAVGNPWTFPFIWMGTYKLGLAMLGIKGAERPDLSHAMAETLASIKSLSFDGVSDSLGPILVPMMVGSIPLALAAWVIFYLMILGAVKARHAKRRPVALAAPTS